MAQVSFVTPGYEEQAQQDEIARRQRMAQLLQQKALQPLQGGMAGNVYVGPSITQGLAQLLSAYGGRKQEEAAQAQSKQLAQALQAKRDQWLGEMPQAQPAKTESMGEIDPSMAQFGSYETQPAKNPSSQDYLAWAMRGMQIDPQMAQFGASMADRIENRESKQEAQKAAMAQRIEELNIRMQDARASQAERLAAQKERDQAQREFQAQQNEMNRQNQQAMARLAAALRPEPNPNLVQVEGPDGKPQFLPAAKAIGLTPYNAKQETAAGQKVTDAKDVLGLLNQAAPLIDTATNSLIGQGVDVLAGAFGKSTAGAQSAAQLKAIEGMLVSKMPKMSGPQSDKDVLLYRQMAGQIGDPAVPRETKKAAMETIAKLNSQYAGVPYKPLFDKQQQSAGQVQSIQTSGALSPAEKAELEQLRKQLGR